MGALLAGPAGEQDAGMELTSTAPPTIGAPDPDTTFARGRFVSGVPFVSRKVGPTLFVRAVDKNLSPQSGVARLESDASRVVVRTPRVCSRQS